MARGRTFLTAMARTLLALASAGLAVAFASSGNTPPFCDRDAGSPAAAAALAAAADELLVGEGKPFARVARGTARLALSQDRGGTDFGTNPDGVYMTYAFDADDALPNLLRNDRVGQQWEQLIASVHDAASSTERTTACACSQDRVKRFGL